ncbi:MAG: purine-nucleoside phosphorylase [Bacteroidales bacterium]|nr:purine-nucleoside phosphorylase [Bacteroidales bacterium]
MLKRIKKSVDYINSKAPFAPAIGIILGSGLGKFIDEVEVISSLPYMEIPGFPQTSVEGHPGNLVFARVHGKCIVIMQGRIHYYEGHSMEELTYPTRILKMLGVHTLLLSNASGGMNPNHEVGDVVLINDHINMMPNPLIGKHYPEFGERFVDMLEPYDKKLRESCLEVAKTNNIPLTEGCYMAVTGPTYETEAEYRFFHLAGADLVGMSTVPEVIVARQMNMRCCALSVVTDLGVPGKIGKLNHQLVQEEAAKAEPKVAILVKGLIEKI